MIREGESNIDTARKPHAYIEWGGPGHETEYVFKTQANRYSEADELSQDLEDRIKAALVEGWSVSNRGERIEIVPPNRERSDETDSKLRGVIESLLGEDYEFPAIK